MKQLMIHGQKVETVFDLIGSDENAMTYSLGWALAECDGFCRSLAELLGIADGFSDVTHIRLQEHVREKGFTDIELHDPGKHHIIIEAKRGFTVPSINQLEKYADRLHADGDTKANKMLVVLAESDRYDQWLSQQVPKSIKDVAVQAISWKKVQQIACDSRVSATTHAEKRWLKNLEKYLGRVTNAQNQNSNMVYVVPLSEDLMFQEQKITFIDIVEKFGKYFHPIGGKGGRPVEPPNYIAFRYRDALQSIHHVESYRVIDNYYPHFLVPQNTYTRERQPHYLYELGKAIKPTHHTPINDRPKYTYITRGWKRCFIDLLLTCGSIAEAVARTKERQNLVYSQDR